jgi:hypothetical protein
MKIAVLSAVALICAICVYIGHGIKGRKLARAKIADGQSESLRDEDPEFTKIFTNAKEIDIPVLSAGEQAGSALASKSRAAVLREFDSPNLTMPPLTLTSRTQSPVRLADRIDEYPS